jgi:hypothetical protein
VRLVVWLEVGRVEVGGVEGVRLEVGRVEGVRLEVGRVEGVRLEVGRVAGARVRGATRGRAARIRVRRGARVGRGACRGACRVGLEVGRVGRAPSCSTYCSIPEIITSVRVVRVELSRFNACTCLSRARSSAGRIRSVVATDVSVAGERLFGAFCVRLLIELIPPARKVSR